MVTDACDYIYKILLLGDCNVGKTSFILRYTEDKFEDTHISTIGVDFKTKLFNLNSEEILKLQIWDTAGQDKFKSITKNYFRGSNGIILMYDITSSYSFVNIKNWITQIRDSVGDNTCIIIVGNKSDLEDSREINIEKGFILANEYKLSFFESSAKENMSVNEIFESLISQMLRKYNESYFDENKNNEKSTNRNRARSYKLYSRFEEKEDKELKQNNKCC